MQFPYVRRDPDTLGGADLRPSLPVTLGDGKEPLRCLGLLDSGATEILLNYDFLIALGLVPCSGKAAMATGIDGVALPAEIHEIVFQIDGLPGSKQRTRVLFVHDVNFDVIIGGAFFDNYRVTLERYSNIIDIAPRS